MSPKKPSGWRNESYRHKLAAKGIKSNSKKGKKAYNKTSRKLLRAQARVNIKEQTNIMGKAYIRMDDDYYITKEDFEELESQGVTDPIPYTERAKHITDLKP